MYLTEKQELGRFLRSDSKNLTYKQRGGNLHILKIKAHLQFSVMLEQGFKTWVFASFIGDISPTATTQKLPFLRTTPVTQTLITHQSSLSAFQL